MRSRSLIHYMASSGEQVLDMKYVKEPLVSATLYKKLCISHFIVPSLYGISPTS